VTQPIESVIDRLIEVGSPSSGHDLEGFVADADHAIFMSHALTDSRVRLAGDSRALLAIDTTVSATTEKLQDVSRALRDVWAELAYKSLQASAITWYREATILRFATYAEQFGMFVTGRIVASGGPYAQLVDRFERDFGKLSGPLPSLPTPD
jgi:hypothetical protein